MSEFTPHWSAQRARSAGGASNASPEPLERGVRQSPSRVSSTQMNEDGNDRRHPANRYRREDAYQKSAVIEPARIGHRVHLYGQEEADDQRPRRKKSMPYPVEESWGIPSRNRLRAYEPARDDGKRQREEQKHAAPASPWPHVNLVAEDQQHRGGDSARSFSISPPPFTATERGRGTDGCRAPIRAFMLPTLSLSESWKTSRSSVPEKR